MLRSAGTESQDACSHTPRALGAAVVYRGGGMCVASRCFLRVSQLLWHMTLDSCPPQLAARPQTPCGPRDRCLRQFSAVPRAIGISRQFWTRWNTTDSDFQRGQVIQSKNTERWTLQAANRPMGDSARIIQWIKSFQWAGLSYRFSYICLETWSGVCRQRNTAPDIFFSSFWNSFPFLSFLKPWWISLPYKAGDFT